MVHVQSCAIHIFARDILGLLHDVTWGSLQSQAGRSSISIHWCFICFPGFYVVLWCFMWVLWGFDPPWSNVVCCTWKFQVQKKTTFLGGSNPHGLHGPISNPPGDEAWTPAYEQVIASARREETQKRRGGVCWWFPIHRGHPLVMAGLYIGKSDSNGWFGGTPMLGNPYLQRKGGLQCSLEILASQSRGTTQVSKTSNTWGQQACRNSMGSKKGDPPICRHVTIGETCHMWCFKMRYGISKSCLLKCELALRSKKAPFKCNPKEQPRGILNPGLTPCKLAYSANR